METGLSHPVKLSPMRKANFDYRKARRIVRRLVRKGLTRGEAAKVAEVSYPTAWQWTAEMEVPSCRRNMGGMTLKILKELASNGYYFQDGLPQAIGAYRTLAKYLPVKRVKLHGMALLVMKGGERKAMEEFLRRRNFRSLRWVKLAYIRKAFGIKPLKRNDRIRERLGIWQ